MSKLDEILESFDWNHEDCGEPECLQTVVNTKAKQQIQQLIQEAREKTVVGTLKSLKNIDANGLYKEYQFSNGKKTNGLYEARDIVLAELKKGQDDGS